MIPWSHKCFLISSCWGWYSSHRFRELIRMDHGEKQVTIQVMWHSHPCPMAHGAAPTSCEAELEKNQVQHVETAGKATIILHKSVDVKPEWSFTPKQILQDWWEGCLTPGFLIGRLLSIKMNDSMCKNIIARVKVNYCAYKIFTAHLKVNYCACEIDSGIFFPLYLLVIILGTLVIPHFEHVEVPLKIPFETDSHLRSPEEYPKYGSKSVRLHRNSWQWHVLIMLTKMPNCWNPIPAHSCRSWSSGVKIDGEYLWPLSHTEFKSFGLQGRPSSCHIWHCWTSTKQLPGSAQLIHIPSPWQPGAAGMWECGGVSHGIMDPTRDPRGLVQSMAL